MVNVAVDFSRQGATYYIVCMGLAKLERVGDSE